MRQSWLRFPGLLGAFVIVLALVTPARADVDWSAYIDHSPRTTAAASAKPAKTSRTKVSKRTSKKIAKAKVKARAKKKPRRK